MSNAVLKKQISKKLIKNGIIIVVMTVIFVVSYFYQSSNTTKLDELTNRINTLDSQIVKKKSEYDQSEANLKEYLAIDKIKLPSEDGYAQGRDRLKVALPIIQEMKDTYVFKKLNFKLSEIKESPSINSQVFAAYDNSITIEFEGASDEYLYSFLNDLKHALPGYIYMKNIKMTKSQDITIASAVDYLGNGPAFVSGSMDLTWTTLRLKSAMSAKDNMPNNNRNNIMRRPPVRR